MKSKVKQNKISKSKLISHNKHLNALIEAIPDAIFLKDADSRWLITNELAKQLFQLHDIAWQGKTEMELAKLHPEFSEAHKANNAGELHWKPTCDWHWQSTSVPDNFGKRILSSRRATQLFSTAPLPDFSRLFICQTRPH